MKRIVPLLVASVLVLGACKTPAPEPEPEPEVSAAGGGADPFARPADPFAGLGKVLALGEQAEALQTKGTTPLKPDQVPGVPAALQQRSDAALDQALAAAGIDHVVVDPAAAVRAPIPQDTIGSRLPLLRAMKHFNARWITKDLVLFKRIAPFPALTTAAKAALLGVARDVMKGGPGALPPGGPGILRQQGDWEVSLTLRPHGRHLGFHYATGPTLAGAVRGAARAARKAYPRKRQASKYGDLAEALDETLTVELEVLHDFGLLTGERDHELLFRTLEPGLFGAHVRKGDRNYVLPPWYSVARNKDSVDDVLDALVDWAKLDKKAYRKADLPIRRFRSVHWREQGPGGEVEDLFRAFPPAPRVRDLSREAVKQGIKGLADWIAVNQVKPSGRYVYRYFPSVDKYSKDEEFNFVRHCVGVFGMLLAYEVTPDPKYIKTIEAGWRYMEDYLHWGGPPVKSNGEFDTSLTEWLGKPLPGKDVAILSYRPARGAAAAKMGAVAVSILGYTHVEKAGLKLSPKNKKILRGLANFLEYMQAPDGSFHHYYVAPGNSYYDSRNSIYPGEILYAVARLYGYYKEERFRRMFRESMVTNMKWFTDRMVQRREDGLYTERLRKDLVQFQPWIAMAMEEMHKHDPDPIYLKNSNLVSEWIIDSYQYTPERAPYPDFLGGYFKVHEELPAMHTFVYTEGTSASYQLAKRAGAPAELLEKFRRSVLSSARFILQQQVVKGRNDYFFPNPELADGGVRYCLNHNKQRIDYEYHALSALYRTYHGMTAEDYALGKKIEEPSWD